MRNGRFHLVVTGSKGLVGGAVMEHAQQQGISVLGVDMLGRGNMTNYVSADLTDLGQVYDVLKDADAVVHMAAINAQRVFTAARTFTTNVTSTYNVFQACAQLGIQRVVTASSIQVNHTITPRNPQGYQYFPIDELHPVDPQDDYSLSKYSGEIIAETFARHYGQTIVSLRFTGVWMPKMVTLQPDEQPDERMALYTYIDPRDAARACFLAATKYLPPNSHTVLLIAARDTFLNMPSDEFARRYYPDAEIRSTLTGYTSFINTSLAERVLGFVPQYSCR